MLKCRVLIDVATRFSGFGQCSTYLFVGFLFQAAYLALLSENIVCFMGICWTWQILNPAFNDHRIVALTLYNAEILALAIKFGPSNSDDPFLFRSTDAGQTWTQQAIYENPPYVYVGTSGNNSSIWREGSILWIKSSNNLYKSEDDGLTG